MAKKSDLTKNEKIGLTEGTVGAVAVAGGGLYLLTQAVGATVALGPVGIIVGAGILIFGGIKLKKKLTSKNKDGDSTS